MERNANKVYNVSDLKNLYRSAYLTVQFQKGNILNTFTHVFFLLLLFNLKHSLKKNKFLGS